MEQNKKAEPSTGGLNRWLDTNPTFSGKNYDAQYETMTTNGQDVHGEANFVMSLQPTPTTVLDAGCGTGRVAIELDRCGLTVAGVDIDPRMLERAREKAPELNWYLGDLATVKIDHQFDLIVLAGNVMIFLTPDTETQVVANLTEHLNQGGYLVAGFQLGSVLTLTAYDNATQAAGLTLVERWSTWDRNPWQPTANYAVSVHQLKPS